MNAPPPNRQRWIDADTADRLTNLARNCPALHTLLYSLDRATSETAAIDALVTTVLVLAYSHAHMHNLTLDVLARALLASPPAKEDANE